MNIFYFIVLVGFAYNSNSDADAVKGTITLLSDSFLSGGQWTGNDLPLLLTGQAKQVNPEINATRLKTLIWAVTSLLENNTALAVCDREKKEELEEKGERRNLSPEIISKIISFQTKQRGTEEIPYLLEIADTQHSNRSHLGESTTTKISGGYETLRADHILEYSAHAVCFRNMSHMTERNEREKEEVKLEIYRRELWRRLYSGPETLMAELIQYAEITIHACYPKRLSDGYDTLRADHILEYSAHAVCFRERENGDRVMNVGMNEGRKKLKIYQRDMETNPFHEPLTLMERPILELDGWNLLILANSEIRLRNNLRADQWKHSALAVCFLFIGKGIVVNPQSKRLSLETNIIVTNHRGYNVFDTLISEIVLYLSKETPWFHQSQTRAQRRRKIHSKIYQRLVYQGRKKFVDSKNFRVLLILHHLSLYVEPRYLLTTKICCLAKLILSTDLIRVEIFLAKLVLQLIETKEEKEIRLTYQIFVRNVDGRTMTLDVRADETIQSLLERIREKDTSLPSHLRLNNGPKPIQAHFTLQDLQIQQGATLEINLSHPGGVKTRAEIAAEQKILQERNEQLQKELEESERLEAIEKEKAEREKAEKEKANREKLERERELQRIRDTRREEARARTVSAADLEDAIEEMNDRLNDKPSRREVEALIQEPVANLESKFVSYFKDLEILVESLQDRVKRKEKIAENQEEVIQDLYAEIKELKKALRDKEGVKPDEKSKSIQPMTKLNIATYAKDKDWAEWKRDFEFEALVGTWSEPQKLSNLMYYLSEDIRKNCKQMTKEQIQNYDEVIKLLEANYGNVKKKSRLEYERDFLDLAMLPTTPVSNFMLTIQETAKLAEIIDDTRIVERFTEGLRPKEVLSATRRVVKEKGYKTSDEVLAVALEEQKKYLEEKQLLGQEERSRDTTSKIRKCKTCETKLEKTDFLFCKSCKEAHQKEKGDKQKKNDSKKPTDKEREAEVLKNKPHLALKHEELRAQDRCFYCAEKLADHSTRSCRDKYPDQRPYQVREKLKKGIDVPEAKNETSQATPRASGS
jgi:hypothetical protein